MVGKLALYVSEGPDLVHYSVNPETGDLTRHETVTVPEIVQYAWVHPTERLIFVASSDGWAGRNHHLTAFRIKPNFGLSQVGNWLPVPHRPIHLTVDATGRYLLAGYNNPSTVSVHTIGADGSIGEPLEQPSAVEAGNYLHQIRLLPSNSAAVVVARGTHKEGFSPEEGSLRLFSFDRGILTLQQTVVSPDEFGPRHLDFHPTMPWVYVSLEPQNALQVFVVDDGRFSASPIFSQSTLATPENVATRQLAGAIHVHPNGRYVYVANRADGRIEHQGVDVFSGGENSIAVFEIDQDSGAITAIQHADPKGFYVRCFALDPSGRILVTASLSDMDVFEDGAVRHKPRTITVFRVEPNGTLAVLRRHDVDTHGKNQWWAGFART